MDCKTFAAHHAAYIDDTLPGVAMTAMREHLDGCARCSRRDADVRRALLLVKNLPSISVSDGFQDRLRARLAAEAPAQQPEKVARTDFSAAKWASAAALLIAVVGIKAWPEASDDAPSRLPAVVASVPADAPVAGDASPAYVASMSTGIPMWPALMLAEEGPLRFASSGVHNASWDASRH